MTLREIGETFFLWGFYLPKGMVPLLPVVWMVSGDRPLWSSSSSDPSPAPQLLFTTLRLVRLGVTTWRPLQLSWSVQLRGGCFYLSGYGMVIGQAGTPRSVLLSLIPEMLGMGLTEGHLSPCADFQGTGRELLRGGPHWGLEPRKSAVHLWFSVSYVKW